MPLTTSTRRGVADLIPVTIRHRNIPTDVALPSSLPLAEILPAVAARLGALDEESAVYGLMLVTEDGKPLSDSRPVDEQGVRAGALLTLEVRSTQAEARYDDLVEAVATAVETKQVAWSREDSLSMSVASTCLLFLVAGLLLLRQGPGQIVTPVCALVCGCLLVLAAFVISRLRGEGAWPLVMTAGALCAVAAHTAFDGPPTGMRMIAAGGALAAVVLACLPLLGEDRWLISGPLLIASALALTGAGVEFLGRPLTSVLAVAAAGAAIISLLAPWLALASVPIDISLPDRTDKPVLEPGTEVTPTLTARVLDAHGLVLSARIACALIILACVPTLTSVGYSGAGLIAAIAAACLLGTRAARSQADVAAGIAGGMAMLAALVITVIVSRTDLLMPATGVVGVTGVVVLLLNVLGPSYRPRLARAADALEIIVLLTILPLAAVVCGTL